jgi:hypothetical protein
MSSAGSWALKAWWRELALILVVTPRKRKRKRKRKKPSTPIATTTTRATPLHAWVLHALQEVVARKDHRNQTPPPTLLLLRLPWKK